MLCPVWLLDVDGVINATRPGWSERPRQAAVYVDGRPFTMRWAPPLIIRIRELHQSGRVEVRWCTTWCPHADALEELFRLPELACALNQPVIPAGAAGDALKYAAARRVLAVEGRPLIWTDDTAVPASGPRRDELTRNGMALLIRPRARNGLQPEHLNDIEAFIADRAPSVTVPR